MKADMQPINAGGDNSFFGVLLPAEVAKLAPILQHVDPQRTSEVLGDTKWTVEQYVERLLDIIEEAQVARNTRLELSAMKQLDTVILRAANVVLNYGGGPLNEYRVPWHCGLPPRADDSKIAL